jgi:hypothetical protein
MGKIIIEFDSVEEADDARLALDGYKWKLAMWDLDMKLRETTKYDVSAVGDKKVSDVEYKVAEKYREIIREILHEYSLNIED